MLYDVTVYEPAITNANLRFTLGTEGAKPLFIIGLNPSTADNKKSDRTITRVMNFATKNDCDSFVMFNLYAQRTPRPAELNKTIDNQLHNENIRHIITALEKYNDVSILASWGENITLRSYLKTCLTDIYTQTKAKKINWLKIGELTKSGHPRHPSRGEYLKLTKFNVEKYLQTIQ